MFTPNEIETFVSYLKTNNYSEETIRAYSSDVRQASEWMRGHSATPRHRASTDDELAAWYLASEPQWSPATISRKYAALRGAYKVVTGQALLDDYRTPTAAPPRPHPIPEGIPGVMRMIQSTRNPRHKALCALTGLLGLRVNEAINVDPDDFNLSDMSQITLRVFGKGHKQRDVPVSAAVWNILVKAYEMSRKNDTTLVPLSNRGARHAITRHGKNAGLTRAISSHDMRATFATAAYENTKDLRAVQELLGHADIKTTQVYTQSSPTAQRNAAAVI